MNTTNPDLFLNLPFWLPETQAAANWLHDLDLIDVHTCSLEALLTLVFSAPSTQAALWLLHIYFSRRYAADEEFLSHFRKIDFCREEPPPTDLIAAMISDAPGREAGELINAAVSRKCQAAPASAASGLGM